MQDKKRLCDSKDKLQRVRRLWLWLTTCEEGTTITSKTIQKRRREENNVHEWRDGDNLSVLNTQPADMSTVSARPQEQAKYTIRDNLIKYKNN